jgi:hypothetical protein
MAYLLSEEQAARISEVFQPYELEDLLRAVEVVKRECEGWGEVQITLKGGDATDICFRGNYKPRLDQSGLAAGNRQAEDPNTAALRALRRKG